MADRISRAEFIAQTRCLIGMPVSHTWRSVGTAIFLEFGLLTKKDEDNNPTGEASAMIQWDWRVEKPKSIAFGSASGKRKITNGLHTLKGRQVVDVTLEGRLPELVLAFSGGLWLHTFTVCEPHPYWSLCLPKGVWLSSRSGGIESEPAEREPAEI